MILRINIGAYVLTDAVRDAVNSLSSDRLFLRSTVSVWDGGMTGALEYLSTRSAPELLIVETQSHGEALFEELNGLADVCQPGTRVIIIGAENDINLFKSLIEQGISQYFVDTVSSAELKAAIADAFTDKSAVAKSRTIAFAGLRGGVGSSVLAHNVAFELANLYDEDVILVDLDIPFGTAALSYNIQPQQTIAEALSQAGSIDEPLLMRYLETGGKNVSLLCAPGHLNSGVEVSANSLELVLNVVKQMASYVILDVPHMWNAWTQDILVDADETVVVGVPDLYNLRDGKNMIEFLSPNRGVEVPTRLILNKVGEAKKGELSDKEFKEVLGMAPTLNIPFDADSFALAMNNGEMLRKVAGKSKVAQAVESLAQVVSGKESLSRIKERKSSGLLGSLFRK
ncbi:MAG: AAA family ATPase [Rhodospirillales bacterium]|nr:AAA family ATPase [Rhodospirillales bacterium]